MEENELIANLGVNLSSLRAGIEQAERALEDYADSTERKTKRATTAWAKHKTSVAGLKAELNDLNSRAYPKTADQLKQQRNHVNNLNKRLYDLHKQQKVGRTEYDSLSKSLRSYNQGLQREIDLQGKRRDVRAGIERIAGKPAGKTVQEVKNQRNEVNKLQRQLQALDLPQGEYKALHGQLNKANTRFGEQLTYLQKTEQELPKLRKEMRALKPPDASRQTIQQLKQQTTHTSRLSKQLNNLKGVMPEQEFNEYANTLERVSMRTEQQLDMARKYRREVPRLRQQMTRMAREAPGETAEQIRRQKQEVSQLNQRLYKLKDAIPNDEYRRYAKQLKDMSDRTDYYLRKVRDQRGAMTRLLHLYDRLSGAMLRQIQLVGILSAVTAGAVAAYAGLGAVANRIGSTLTTTSRKIGMTTEELQRLEIAGSLTGTMVQGTREALQELSVSMQDAVNESGDMKKVFGELGISMGQVRSHGNQVSDMFTMVMEGLADIDNVSKRLSLAEEIFTEQQARTILNLTGKLDEAKAVADEFGVVMKDSVAQNSHEAWTMIRALWVILKRQFATAAAQASEQVKGMAAAFGEFIRQNNVFKGTFVPTLKIAKSIIAGLVDVIQSVYAALKFMYDNAWAVKEAFKLLIGLGITKAVTRIASSMWTAVKATSAWTVAVNSLTASMKALGRVMIYYLAIEAVLMAIEGFKDIEKAAKESGKEVTMSWGDAGLAAADNFVNSMLNGMAQGGTIIAGLVHGIGRPIIEYFKVAGLDTIEAFIETFLKGGMQLGVVLRRIIVAPIDMTIDRFKNAGLEAAEVFINSIVSAWMTFSKSIDRLLKVITDPIKAGLSEAIIGGLDPLREAQPLKEARVAASQAIADVKNIPNMAEEMFDFQAVDFTPEKDAEETMSKIKQVFDKSAEELGKELTTGMKKELEKVQDMDLIDLTFWRDDEPTLETMARGGKEAWEELRDVIRETSKNVKWISEQGRMVELAPAEIAREYKEATEEEKSEIKKAVEEGKSLEEVIKAIVGDIENYNKNLDRGNEQLDEMSTSWDSIKNLGVWEQLKRGGVVAMDTLKEETTNWASMTEEAITDAFNSMSETLTDFVMKGKADFQELANSVLRMITQMMIKFMMFKAIQAGAGMSGPIGGAFSGMMNMMTAAQGAVVEHGKQLKRFAQGGVVNEPTAFPMANGGTGIMGEDGAEAVMPLARTPNGDLGVKSSDAGGVNVTNNVTVQAPEGQISRQSMHQLQKSLGKSVRRSLDRDGG